MNTLTIRQAVLADLEALAPLFDGYRQFYGQPSDISAAHAFLRARFEHGESFVFIALDGDTPVGWALPSSTRVSRPSRWRASSCSTTSSCMNARAGKAWPQNCCPQRRNLRRSWAPLAGSATNSSWLITFRFRHNSALEPATHFAREQRHPHLSFLAAPLNYSKTKSLRGIR